MTTLALPPAGRERPNRMLHVGALLAGTSLLMAMGALMAAYVNVRDAADRWPPKGVKVDNYLGAILLITLLLSSALAEWGASAARRSLRRQALAGLALTALMGLAFLNGSWYLGSRFGFGVDSHPYGAMAYAFVGLSAVATLAGIVALAAAMVKVLAGQADGGDSDPARAAASFWHFVVGAWAIAYAALFMVK
ncbi:MAG TPA: cytochrome c oxidase subunit 3 [Acidimicrobiales bacterium]|nr:cytochrome c oxidase subunit 3 [Acidimicrobiales bacterium]